jgi:hypothetical protein
MGRMSDEFIEDPDQHPLDRLVGPFLDAAALTAYLSVTPAELTALVESGQLLETKLGDGSSLYPTFQFEDRALLPHLDEVIGALYHERHDGWSIGIMLNAKEPAWGDRTAAELLRGDWAEEVLHQLKFDERAPLDKRARFAVQYAIASVVVDKLVEQTLDLPVRIEPASTVVGEGPDGFGAGVLVSHRSLPRSVALLSFSLRGDPDAIATGLAETLRQQSPEFSKALESTSSSTGLDFVVDDLARYAEPAELGEGLVGRRVKLARDRGPGIREIIRIVVVEESRTPGVVSAEGREYTSADGWSAFLEVSQ